MSGEDVGRPRTDEARLADHAAVLADAIDAALPDWVLRSVTDVAERQSLPVGSELRAAALAAGAQARDEIGSRVRDLLAMDVDDQPTGPLALLREAVRYPTAVLHDAGVAPVRRDPFVERAFPGDVYDLSPASFSDIGPHLAEPGLVWGAAKAHVVLVRRRRDGRR